METCRVSDLAMTVKNVQVEPGYTTENFIIYGERGPAQKPFLASVDFSKIHTRNCEFFISKFLFYGFMYYGNFTFFRKVTVSNRKFYGSLPQKNGTGKN